MIQRDLDASQLDSDKFGVSAAFVQNAIQYWQTDYDWRKVENRVNDLPYVFIVKWRMPDDKLQKLHGGNR